MATYIQANCTTSKSPAGPQTVMSVILHSLAVKRQRAALRRLDPTALADVGITRVQADMEAARPIWDVPANWRQKSNGC